MVWVLLVIFLILVPPKSYAADYFCKLTDSIVPVTGEFSVVCTGMSDVAAYRVRPAISSGSIMIKAENTDWVNSNETWSVMPVIKKGTEPKLVLKTVPSDFQKSYFRLTFQDLVNGNTATSEHMVLYGKKYVEDSLAKISASIAVLETTPATIIPEEILVETTSAVSRTGNVKVLFLVSMVIAGFSAYIILREKGPV